MIKESKINIVSIESSQSYSSQINYYTRILEKKNECNNCYEVIFYVFITTISNSINFLLMEWESILNERGG